MDQFFRVTSTVLLWRISVESVEIRYEMECLRYHLCDTFGIVNVSLCESVRCDEM